MVRILNKGKDDQVNFHLWVIRPRRPSLLVWQRHMEEVLL